MNKKLIKQIEELPGVKTVEVDGNKFHGTFEAEKDIVLKCTNNEQWEFAVKKTFNRGTPYVFGSDSNYQKGSVYNAINLINPGVQHISYWLNIGCIEISFSEYLTDYNLKAEWEKYWINEAERRGFVAGVKHMGMQNKKHTSFTVVKLRVSSSMSMLYGGDCAGCICNSDGKWATIIPKIELVKGEIYLFKATNLGSMTVRHNKDNICYSCTGYKGDFFANTEFGYDSFIEATNKQKAKHANKEYKNGYYWNGKELIKFK